jgi:prolyl oligopeptidase
VDDLLKGDRRLEVLFEPSARVSLADVERTRDRVLLQTLDNVKSRLTALSLKDGAWDRTDIPRLASAPRTSRPRPTSRRISSSPTRISRLPSRWALRKRGPAGEGQVDAGFLRRRGDDDSAARSHIEGRTKIPYFVVRPKGTKDDGTAPTLLYAYGGFEVSELPNYSGVLGAAWLSAVACTCSPTSAAAESSVPPGTRPPSKRSTSTTSRISRRSRGT